MAGCGGGGGGGEPLLPAQNVTISGTVDDGLPNSPIQAARCRFIDLNGDQVGTGGTSNQDGIYRIVVPPNIEGQINCKPENLNNLTIFTYSSTLGMAAGGTITGEDVSPVTTVVAQKVYSENRPDKTAHKEELLRSIETLTDADLVLVARLSSRLYKAMLAEKIDVNYGGEGAGGGNGGNGGDGGGVGGDAGDGGDFSPIPNARCEFVISSDLRNASVLYSAALDDFKDDGIINRPDLKSAVETIYPELQNHTAEEIKAAFDKVFPSSIGHAYVDVTDQNGEYFIKGVPANVPGFVRCLPPGQEKLLLATFVRGLAKDEELTGQRVIPATTVFSTNIASKLGGDIGATHENFLSDIAGLDVQILQDGGVVSGFQLRPGTVPANKDVGLVAFSATSLFNILYKNGVNVDYLAALDDFTTKGEIDPAFLQNTLGIPSVQANEYSRVVDDSVGATGSALETDIGTALSTARIIVMVTDMLGGDPIPGATVDITGDISCDGCGTTTDSTGIVTLTLSGVSNEATDITVEASGLPGFAPATATTKIVAFATVNLEVPLTTTFPLSVQIGGNGTGTVTGSDGGIDCLFNGGIESGACSADLNSGSLLVLTAIPNDGSTFSGWSGGGCSGTSPCTVMMDQARTVTAFFALIPQTPPDYTLTVSRAGTGSGTVTSSPSGINCGTDCTQNYEDGAQVTLTAVPTSGSTFNGWSGGGCSGTSPCTVTMDQARTVTASFALIPQTPPDYTLTVTRAGTGSGTVTSSPSGINCGTDCTQDYVDGARVTLTAVPTSGSTFNGWSGGGCNGTSPCTVTMNQARTVTANFTAQFTLTVQGGSNGTGTVTDNIGDIQCFINGTSESGICSDTYESGTAVTLAADPTGDSTFTGWSGGGCNGTSPCTVTMNQARTVTANFATSFTLTVQGGGNGTGSVSSNPSGISCSINGTTESGDCSQNYNGDTQVTLTPDPTGGSRFTGWSGGGCSGNTPCTVTMDQSRLVTANFTIATVFNFDLNTQGWRMVGLYDDGDLTPIAGFFDDRSPPYYDPNEAGFGAIALGENDFDLPASSSGSQSLHWDLNSPDLSNYLDWQASPNITYDITGEFINSSSPIFVEAVLHVRKPDGAESYFSDFAFHPIPLGSSGGWNTHSLDVTSLGIPSGTVILNLNLRIFFDPLSSIDGYIAVDNVTP